MLQSNNVFLPLIMPPYNGIPGTRRSFRPQAQSALFLQIWILHFGGLKISWTVFKYGGQISHRRIR